MNHPRVLFQEIYIPIVNRINIEENDLLGIHHVAGTVSILTNIQNNVNGITLPYDVEYYQLSLTAKIDLDEVDLPIGKCLN